MSHQGGKRETGAAGERGGGSGVEAKRGEKARVRAQGCCGQR